MDRLGLFSRIHGESGCVSVGAVGEECMALRVQSRDFSGDEGSQGLLVIWPLVK